MVPEAVERILPNAIHNTGDSSPKRTGMGETHAKDGGEDSIVPKPIQSSSRFTIFIQFPALLTIIAEAVPESVERILPNAIHNTGDSSPKRTGMGETHAKDGGEDSIVPKPIQSLS